MIEVDAKLILTGIGMVCTAVSAIAGASWSASRAVTKTKETISALTSKVDSLSAESKAFDYANDTVAREVAALKERCSVLERDQDHSMRDIKATEERFAKALETGMDSLRREMRAEFNSLREILLRKDG